MKNKIITLSLAVALIPSVSFAQEVNLNQKNNISTSVSIYNDNLAFVKDTRKAVLSSGKNNVAFVGVAKQMRPETAIISAENVTVIEQNYEYNLINQNNILKEYVGKEVVTAVINPMNGRDIFDKAILIDNTNGPVLKFSHGIETNFPGRIVVSKLPSGLRNSPTLTSYLQTDASGEKEVELSYLTRGMMWNADYIVNIKDKELMDITSFVTINNTSGIDYVDANISLVSGTVNQVNKHNNVQYLAQQRVYKSLPMADAAMEMGGGMSQGNVGEYYIYDVPEKTTIKDNQSKQVRLFKSNDVVFETEYRFVSPLGLSFYSDTEEFKNSNPTLIYKLKNTKETKLGTPLPQGVMRFYQNDDKSNSQFVGESEISQTAVGGEVELTLGNVSDIFVKGVVSDSMQIADKIKEYTIKMTVNNAKDEDVKVILSQNIYNNWSIISENIKSIKKTKNSLSWEIDVPKSSSTDLEFKVRIRS